MGWGIGDKWIVVSEYGDVQVAGSGRRSKFDVGVERVQDF